MKRISLVVSLVALASIAGSVPGRAADWKSLGEQRIPYPDLRRTDSATFPVAAGAGAFSKLQIEIEGNVLQIGTVKVTFADGQTFSAEVDNYVGWGRSQVVDLPSAKELQKVEVAYRSARMTDRHHPIVIKLLGSS